MTGVMEPRGVALPGQEADLTVLWCDAVGSFDEFPWLPTFTSQSFPEIMLYVLLVCPEPPGTSSQSLRSRWCAQQGIFVRVSLLLSAGT